MISSLQIEDSPQSGTKLFDLFTIEGPRLAFNQKAYYCLVPRSGPRGASIDNWNRQRSLMRGGKQAS